MCDFGEYGNMLEYTIKAVEDILFNDCSHYEVKSSEVWSKDFIPWKEENINVSRQLTREEHGYELLQGSGLVNGQLLGGCIDVFPMVIGTDVWPTKE